MAELDQAITDTATGPQSASVDGSSVQAQDLSKLIEADRYQNSKAAFRSRSPLRFTKIIPPGPV